jgi:putative colanic acid biosynthesis glycosyltransferase
MSPFFSIVTIVRNDLPGLIRTRESVISQEFKNFEWIVIDGASTDGSTEFIRSLQIDNFQWISEPDKGIYDAMNKGIKLATGNYVNFLNAGDYYQENNILEIICNEINDKSISADLIFGGANLVMKNGIHYYRKPKTIKYVPYGLPSIHQSTYYRTELLKENNYDERFKICGDYYLICKLSLLSLSVLIIDTPLVAFSIGGVSYTRPMLLIRESMDIKKHILKLNLFFRVFVLTRMIVSFLGMYTINNLVRKRK